MPANTARGYPYPLGTDRVMDGDDAIKNLATAVDTKTGVGCVVRPLINIPTGPTSTSVAITFPAGLFTAAPSVVALPESSAPGAFNVSVGAISTSGATIFANRGSGSAYPNLPVHVIARA